jgi:hypothetical protein
MTLDSSSNNNNEIYEIRMAGCVHLHIWDARMLVTGAIETRFDIETCTKQDYYLCPKCAAPRENGVTDFCMSSVLHKVLRVGNSHL